MNIFPKKDFTKELASVFDKFANRQFPSLRQQLDQNFDTRYDAFWLQIKKKQKTLFNAEDMVSPSDVRLEFDMTVCRALGVHITREELCDLYKVIVEEMIITRGLTRD
jgi:hypothetical protein